MPALAVLPGVVIASAATGTPGFARYGETIVIRHSPGFYSLYAHLEQRMLPQLSLVVAGSMIGAVGDTETMTSRTGSPHLHLEFLSHWPPRGRDLDRMDPTAILERLGVRAQPRSHLEIIAGGPADCRGRPVVPFVAPPPAAAAIGGGALVLALLAFAFSNS